jgi:hypothetical protein
LRRRRHAIPDRSMKSARVSEARSASRPLASRSALRRSS